MKGLCPLSFTPHRERGRVDRSARGRDAIDDDESQRRAWHVDAFPEAHRSHECALFISLEFIEERGFWQLPLNQHGRLERLLQRFAHCFDDPKRRAEHERTSWRHFDQFTNPLRGACDEGGIVDGRKVVGGVEKRLLFVVQAAGCRQLLDRHVTDAVEAESAAEEVELTIGREACTREHDGVSPVKQALDEKIANLDGRAR